MEKVGELLLELSISNVMIPVGMIEARLPTEGRAYLLL